VRVIARIDAVEEPFQVGLDHGERVRSSCVTSASKLRRCSSSACRRVTIELKRGQARALRPAVFRHAHRNSRLGHAPLASIISPTARQRVSMPCDEDQADEDEHEWTILNIPGTGMACELQSHPATKTEPQTRHS